ncbi:MAG: two-component system sensor histidine kinase NtrB [Actinomycetota bacterium]
MKQPEEKTDPLSRAFSDARFRALVQRSCDVITVIGPDISVLYVSPSVETIMGYRQDELVGKVGLDFIHPDDSLAAAQRLGDVLGEPGATALLELRAQHKNGSWRWFEVSLHNLLHDPDVQGIVINQRDITERKNLQLQARQQQKMEAVGQLAGGVAHDFANLLSVISGCSHVLKESQDEPGERDGELLDAIIDAAEKGAHLTRQLLSFARDTPFHLENVDFGELIAGFRSLLQLRLGSGNGLEIDTPPDLWLAHIDRSECEQMLLNLAANAGAAMPEGGTVRISLVNEVVEATGDLDDGAAPGRYIRLTFSDEGIGMEPHMLQHVFEPFFTTRRETGGTGLGLANVYTAVTKAGGAIAVESELGSGTTFTIRLPAIEPIES